METTIFGIKFRVEILILIVVIYWILAGHLVCGCSKFPLMGMLTGKVDPIEGFVGTLNDGESASYSLGKYMTPTQALNYYTILQAFQTAMGRQV